MTKWTRARTVMRCGGPAADFHLIAVGDPVLVIRPEGLRRELIRCERCAGPAPPMPALETDERRHAPRRAHEPVNLKQIARVIDFKLRVAGEEG